MKTDKNILVAFILNAVFSIIEFVGGIVTGSVAILSDSVHDLGDSISIGFAYFLEKKSEKAPDNSHTYGYLRYSVLGSFVTTFILITGSVFVGCNAIMRIIHPVEINYDGMICFAILGALINFIASYFTSGGHSINQKAVNLHMLEDMLGWVVVLIGAIVMKFTDIAYIDPVMSIGVTVFVFINAIKNLMLIVDLFLEKTPRGVCLEELKNNLSNIDGVMDVHHLHIRSIDGVNNVATVHIVTENAMDIKEKVREKLKESHISHVTIETETPDEECKEINCCINSVDITTHHHHHNH